MRTFSCSRNMNANVAERFVAIARIVAETADSDKQFRHVSIIVSGKSIVGVGINGYKTHTITQEMGYRNNLIHSEIDAYSKVRHRAGSYTLLNFRFNKHGELRNSKPCRYCHPWCMEIFDEIWYSTNGGMRKLK